MLELIVVIAVVAILLAIAVPSFSDLTQRNRVATEVNGFVGDLQYARAEAIRRGERVTVCATDNGSSCGSSTSSWNNGWLVFNDTNEDQTITTGETVMRKQGKWPGTDKMTATNSVIALSYSRDGFAVGLPASGTVTLTLKTTPVNAGATRCVALNLAGRIQVLTAGSTCS